jgi:hypothetical protein
LVVSVAPNFAVTENLSNPNVGQEGTLDSAFLLGRALASANERKALREEVREMAGAGNWLSVYARDVASLTLVGHHRFRTEPTLPLKETTAAI